MTTDNQAAVQMVCRGNTLAIKFLEDVTEILHIWDDLIDRDKPLQDTQINQGFWKALVDLPRNAFYAANFQQLNTLLMVAIVNWQIATRMERETQNETDLEIAFILRSSYIDLVTGVALLLGGVEHATAMLLPARRMWHDEGFLGYRKALVAEKIARGD